jgi:beta-glucosidase
MGRQCKLTGASGEHQVGIVVSLEPKYAASDAAEDVAATARRCLHEPARISIPCFSGAIRTRFPRSSPAKRGRWPADELALIHQPIDFVRINYYTRRVTRHDRDHWLLHAAPPRDKSRRPYTEQDGKYSREI